MAKRLTVFYSWQSDTPAEQNRRFIEKAIQEALNRLKSGAELEEALRDTSIELDSDTKNVAGSPPIEAGLVGIKGYPITVNSFNIAGKSLRDSISWHDEVSTYDKPAWEILGPFFDRIWANCGIARTTQHHAELVKRFTPRI